MKLWTPAVAIVSALLVAACGSAPAESTPPPKPKAVPAAEIVAPRPAPQEPVDAEEPESGESEEHESGSTARDLELARMELKIAEQTAQHAMGESREDVRAARESLHLAQMALKQFVEREAPRRLESAQISLDRARYDAEEAGDEFKELEAMYSADEFASMTKELVLKRGRRHMELAQRDLAVEEKDLEDLQQYELPRERRELEDEVKSAETGVTLAEQSAATTELEQRLAVEQARDEVEEVLEELGMGDAEDGE